MFILEWMGKHSLSIFILITSNIAVILLQGFYWRDPHNNIVSTDLIHQLLARKHLWPYYIWCCLEELRLPFFAEFSWIGSLGCDTIRTEMISQLPEFLIQVRSLSSIIIWEVIILHYYLGPLKEQMLYCIKYNWHTRQIYSLLMALDKIEKI